MDRRIPAESCNPGLMETLEPRLLLSAAYPWASVQVTDPGTLVVDVQCVDYEIVPAAGHDDVTADSLEGEGWPAAPALPGSTLRVALPPDADVDSLWLEPLGGNTLSLGVGVQPEYGTTSAAPSIDGVDPSVYLEPVLPDPQGWYDLDDYSLVSAQQMGRWKVAEISYSPFAFNEITGELTVTADAAFALHYDLTDPMPAELLDNDITDASAADMLVNYDDALTWYSAEATGMNAFAPMTAATGAPPSAPAIADYVIITTQSIQSGSTQMSNFVAHKQARGHTVQVVTENIWGGGTGNAAANAIRQWLQMNYSSLGIQHVLLIGNPNPSTGNVPMKSTLPLASDPAVPTDYFYADLTSNWDTDGDGTFGEWSQDISSRPLHEVLVGRIPVYGTSYTTLDSILSKTMSYENATSTSWRNNALLPMAVLNYNNEDYGGFPRQDATAVATNLISNVLNPNGYGNYTLYETGGLAPVTLTPSAALTQTNLVNEWAGTGPNWTGNRYGIVPWVGHGGQTNTARKVWTGPDDGDGVPEAAEMTWPNMFANSNAASLNDNYPSVVVQASCNNGYPENNANLGYSLLANGGIGTISASRITYYEPNWNTTSGYVWGDNMAYSYYVTDQMVNSPNTVSTAAALQWCRENFGGSPHSWLAYGWKNACCFNLYGDPEIMLGSQQAQQDWGDAPDAQQPFSQYPTLAANNGAFHPIVPGLFLGNQVDAEFDGQPVDLDGVDEDGVTFTSPVAPGMTNATVQVVASQPGFLDAWIDFNGDTSWAGPGEQIFFSTFLTAGVNNLTFAVPATALPGLQTWSRFRFSPQGGLAFWGGAPDGEVEDHQLFIDDLDLGDAPDQPYPTLLGSNGAAHVIGMQPMYFMGATVDPEPDGQPTPIADGDDIDGNNDDDGVNLLTPLIPGQAAQVDILLPIAPGGFLDAWIDFDGDGTWSQPNEQIFASQPLAPGLTSLTFNVPASAVPGQTFARFRMSSYGGLSYTGLATDGEVEDYMYFIEETLDFGDAPDGPYQTLLINDGARHAQPSALFLGNSVDAEIDGQPTANADGDDNDGNDDEDGVTFVTPLVPGQPTQIDITASMPGMLDAWIDFDGNGTWADPQDQIALSIPVNPGLNTLPGVFVPLGPTAGTAYARFRISTNGGLMDFGWAPDGEVEDYILNITAAPGTPDLLATSDTGVSQTDDLTNLNNATGADVLAFSVPGTTAGAEVRVYANGVEIGMAVAGGATTTVVTNGAVAMPDGPQNITARQALPGEFESADSGTLPIFVDTAPPSVTSAYAMPTATDRPDQLTTMNYVFDENLSATCDVGDLSIKNMTAGGTTVSMTGASMTYTSTPETAAWDISSLTMPASYYQFTLAGAGMTDVAGNNLDGDGDGAAGGDHVSTFYKALAGDADLDGDVDLTDLAILAANYGNGPTPPMLWGAGDFDGDDDTDLTDLAILASNYGQNVVPPPAAAAPLSTSVETYEADFTPRREYESNDAALQHDRDRLVDDGDDLPGGPRLGRSWADDVEDPFDALDEARVRPALG